MNAKHSYFDTLNMTKKILDLELRHWCQRGKEENVSFDYNKIYVVLEYSLSAEDDEKLFGKVLEVLHDYNKENRQQLTSYFAHDRSQDNIGSWGTIKPR
jgi:hypothetical protein